jgi:hypothetical protein
MTPGVPDGGDKTKRLKILQCLKAAIENEAEELAHDASAQTLAAVAWHARNLLELYVWAHYCRMSERNAKLFAEDASRDMVDVLTIAFNFPTHLTTDTADTQTILREAQEAHGAIVKTANEHGFDAVDEEYKKVSAAAKEVGMGDLWKYLNKVLSKFAHPTALLVIAMPHAGERELKLKQGFCESARLGSKNALEMIIEFCEGQA